MHKVSCSPAIVFERKILIDMPDQAINQELFAAMLSNSGYVPPVQAVVAALRPGWLIEWEADWTGVRYFAIVLGVVTMGGRPSELDLVVKVVCSRKTFIFPGQIVAIHAVGEGDLDRFRA